MGGEMDDLRYPADDLRLPHGPNGATLLAVTSVRRSVWCRLNVHHRWRTEWNEENKPFRRCATCGKDDWGKRNGPLDGVWITGV